MPASHDSAKVTFIHVTLRDNASILEKSIRLLRRDNQDSSHIVVCPRRDVAYLASVLEPIGPDILVRDETEIYAIGDLMEDLESAISGSPVPIKSTNPEGWFYQQILKLLLIVELATDLGPRNVVMLDADTCLIRKKFPFFLADGTSISYATLNESHGAYYRSSMSLIGGDRDPIAYRSRRRYISSTCQIASLSASESAAFARFLALRAGGDPADLSSRQGKRAIVRLILREAMRHPTLDSEGHYMSPISEQDIIGYFKYHYFNAQQVPLKYFRGKEIPNPTDLQVGVLKRLGYHHYSSESWDRESRFAHHWWFFLPIVLADSIRQDFKRLRYWFRVGRHP